MVESGGNHIRTGSGPGSPAGQPRWGGGSDRRDAQPRVAIALLTLSIWPVATAPGSDKRRVAAQSRNEI
jgi:hypothetical protein